VANQQEEPSQGTGPEHFGESALTREKRLRVQGMMVFLGSLTHGLEDLLGKGAKAVSLRAGREVGLARPVIRKEADLRKALDQVRQEMVTMEIDWPFELFVPEGEESPISVNDHGETEIRMPFGNCLVRCSLFRYGFPQEMSLCQTKHGLFCGLFEKIYGVRAHLDIIHSGENACLLKLRFRDPNHAMGEDR